MFYPMRATLLAGAVMLVFPCASTFADESDALKLNDNASRISYSLGYQIGGDFKRQGVEMNPEAVVMGIEDAMSGAEPKITQKAMNEILAELKRRVVADERKQLPASSGAPKASNARERELTNIAEGKAFLDENVKKPGVKTTASGLQTKSRGRTTRSR